MKVDAPHILIKILSLHRDTLWLYFEILRNIYTSLKPYFETLTTSKNFETRSQVQNPNLEHKHKI